VVEKTVQWTEAQRRAIETRGSNLLVAASAGTGKTAVLVERCLQLIVAPKDPIDIDRLLVVTFTEAAAAEMRNRLSAALRKRLEPETADARLRRQLVLLDRASISTLHSYALRTLQEHFFRLGLSPNLNVMDPEEADLLCVETLDEVFETLYVNEGEAGPGFRRLVGRYGSNGHDEPVRRVVLDLWSFLRSLPWPDHWRATVLASYPAANDKRRFDEWPLSGSFVATLEEDLRRLEAEARTASQWAYDADPSFEPYENHFEAVAEALKEMLERLAADGYDAAQPLIADYKYSKLPTVKGIVETLREQVKRRNDVIKNDFKRTLQAKWCALSGEQWLATLRATRPDVEMLFEVVDRFDKSFSQAKRERGELDFQDLERLCFDLLADSETSSPERLIPSAAAREIRDRYEAVLVDEYQDISPLQDAILQLSSRQDDPARPSNLFMVGDVKQSIYRFRLAEPEIFLQKMHDCAPNDETPEQEKSKIQNPKSKIGNRIDLNENFRSRAPLLSALNAMFRLIMIPAVGKIAYDKSAELRGGGDYPAETPPGLPPPATGAPVEVHFFDRAAQIASGNDNEDEPGAAVSAETSAENGEADDLEQIEIEAMWVAERIKTMVETKEFSIFDRNAKAYRPVAHRDVAVLLQTAVYKAEVFVRVMRALGVPAYTDAGSGYLLTTEIRDMLSLLELLDNRRQDVAVAAVLRSPLVGLSEDDLARIRIHRRGDDFFGAAVAFADNGPSEPLRRRLREFLENLERWRTLARRGPLAQALWTIYDETGYLDYVTAMEDGAQRRANLIGLYDRARQFDEFSRRGLGRFLEFIRRLEETEGELGAPPALSEAEDVVRVMSIHKSKGLEFPVVVIPDIGKLFNFSNARGDLVSDRHLGIAMRQVDTARGIKFPTAAHLVVARRVEREMLAEQMRLLYVAMTRAREKLLLCGSVEIDRARRDWLSRGSKRGTGVPPVNERTEGESPPPAGSPLDPATVGSARCFADWLGPALAKLGYVGESDSDAGAGSKGRQFVIHYHRADEWRGRQLKRREPAGDMDHLRKIAAMEPLAPPPHDSEAVAQIMERLNWRYPWQPLTEVRGKISVTEIKRRFEAEREADESLPHIFTASTIRRPAFLMAQEGKAAALTATELGTATHTVLRYLDPAVFPIVGAPPAAPVAPTSPIAPNASAVPFAPVEEAAIRRQIEQMAARGLLTPVEAAAVDAATIARFLDSPLGIQIREQPNRVQRELPFSLALRADEIESGRIGEIDNLSLLPDAATNRHDDDRKSKIQNPKSEMEWVLVQGVIDCLLERPEGFVLIDYKTDRVAAETVAARADSYRTQMALYARAVETIFRRPVVVQTLYFLHCGVAVEMSPGK
jgi:ATP-dependent helicase/nuclease subunit A